MNRVLNRTGGIAPLLAAALLSWTSTVAEAQVVGVDEATFELSRGDQVIGEERVMLQRTGVGQSARVIGQSEIRMLDGTEMRPRLQASAEFRAMLYQNKFSGAEVGEVQVTRAGRRLVARTETDAGEAQREFPASDATLLLEPEVVLLYYLVRPWVEGDGAMLAVLDPRASRQSRMSLTIMGTEEVRIGREIFPTTRIRLEADGDVRDVWLDSDGRVMRVDVPGTGFSARRTTR